MTTPKEALEYGLEAVRESFASAKTRDEQLLAEARYSAIESAIASLQGEDAVEKVKALAHRFWSIHPSTIAAMNLTREEFYVREMMALLATGLVPDEAAVRAGERALGDVFNELVRRMNFDGMDPRTFTLGELERAIDGAEFPK